MQYGSPDAFGQQTGQTIDDQYVEGISIVRHPSGGPRLHVWTFAYGVSAVQALSISCPCNGGAAPPTFVGDDYFCDSGSYEPCCGTTWFPDLLFTLEREGLDSTTALGGTDCRQGFGLNYTWFEKQMEGLPTLDPIEVRVMGVMDNELTAITEMELLVS